MKTYKGVAVYVDQCILDPCSSLRFIWPRTATTLPFSLLSVAIPTAETFSDCCIYLTFLFSSDKSMDFCVLTSLRLESWHFCNMHNLRLTYYECYVVCKMLQNLCIYEQFTGLSSYNYALNFLKVLSWQLYLLTPSLLPIHLWGFNHLGFTLMRIHSCTLK